MWELIPKINHPIERIKEPVTVHLKLYPKTWRVVTLFLKKKLKKEKTVKLKLNGFKTHKPYNQLNFNFQ